MLAPSDRSLKVNPSGGCEMSRHFKEAARAPVRGKRSGSGPAAESCGKSITMAKLCQDPDVLFWEAGMQEVQVMLDTA